MHAPEVPLDRLDWLLAKATSLATLLVMLVIVADVVARYAFGQPIGWIYDLVSLYFINLTLYFMASETLRSGAHIALDLKLRLLPKPVWTALQVLAWIGVAVALGLSAWQVGRSAISAAIAGEVHPGLYEWPVWLERGIPALGLALLVLRIVLRLVRFGLSGDATVLTGRHPAPDGEAA